jgi:adenylosuccinate synthase
VSALDAIALTKLDVLDEHDEIRIAIGYTIDGKPVSAVPARADLYERARPVYRTFPGWKTSIAGVESWEALPTRAREYVSALEEIVGAKVGLLSTGAKREETIVRPGTALDDWLKATVGQPA